MKAGMLVAFLSESENANAAELEKLRRENYGLKTTVKNLRSKVNKFYQNY